MEGQRFRQHSLVEECCDPPVILPMSLAGTKLWQSGQHRPNRWLTPIVFQGVGWWFTRMAVHSHGVSDRQTVAHPHSSPVITEGQMIPPPTRVATPSDQGGNQSPNNYCTGVNLTWKGPITSSRANCSGPIGQNCSRVNVSWNSFSLENMQLTVPLHQQMNLSTSKGTLPHRQLNLSTSK